MVKQVRKKSLKSRFLLLFALSLVSILGMSYFLDQVERSPIVLCQSSWGFPKIQGVKYYTKPEKIVVKPWLGQHHVYAVFMIPQEYRHDYLFTLNLPGENTRCGAIKRTNQSVIAGVTAKPEHYLLKGYLNTRIALNLIIQGKLNELKQSQNWQLGYAKKNS
ncbi:hypothetical protein Nos7524_1036 [Nostoc sp. PCC 7524]|nr:hypothetical protein Nos7524_1036 [Nostoc sp. PCC 7524]